MRRINMLAIAILFFIYLRGQAQEFHCNYVEDSLPQIQLFSSPDTIRGLAIYCCWESLYTHSLPAYAYSIWDSSQRESVPHYYMDMTNNKVIFFADVISRDSNNCITSNIDPGPGYSISWAYQQDIFIKTDSLVNFADYDNDGPNGIPASLDSVGDDDGFVDAVYFIDMWRDPNWDSFNLLGDFVTNDRSFLGDTIRIGYSNGIDIRAGSVRNLTLSGICHELGHGFRLPDLYHLMDSSVDDSLEHWGLGDFSIMSGWGFRQRPSPFDPFCKKKAGMVSPIVIDWPKYEVYLNDYEASDTCYQLQKVYYANPAQYFLITAYRYPDSTTSYWSRNLPIPGPEVSAPGGILIWHVNDDAPTYSNKFGNYNMKGVDIESAHGLWNVDWDSLAFITANTSIGHDSLDFNGIYNCYSPYQAGNKSCFFEGNSFKTFDGLSNPNSNFNSLSWQVTLSHLAVRNIRPNANGLFLADLLINNWYGQLAASTTWGDTTRHTGYAITGDITVAAGDTLKIRRGTTVYFQKFEDNQHTTGDTLCEITVYGTLIAEGTSNDSILFVPSSEQLGNAQPGHWYGIHFMTGSKGVMRYCAIRDALNGIEMEDSAYVEINQCLIKSNSAAGIYNRKGILQIDSSLVIANGVYGLYSYAAVAIVNSCTFRSNKSYGLYCSNAIADSTIISNCLIDFGGVGINYTSQYGIFTDLDKMRISSSTIKEYGQGAVRLNNSDCPILDCILKPNGTLGVYAYDHSDPKIRHCNFTSLPIGVKATNYSVPDIGHVSWGTADSGICDFSNCNPYYIRFEYPTSPSPVLWAEKNYFAVAQPPAGKFYGNVDYNPWIAWDPFPKREIIQDMAMAYELHQNYPNPFNPSTNISFTLSSPNQTIVTIHNILGQMVKTLLNVYMNSGEHSIVWDGTDASGNPVSSGVYFFSIHSGEYVQSKKMTLLR